MSELDACRIDDVGPIPVTQPQSMAELGAIVRRAAAEGQAVYPLGGRTMLDLGLPPSRSGVVVDLRRLDQIIDYPARDMTITMQAGIPIARLQALLATENQRLPIDVPQPELATLGGVVAANVSGPRRYGFGTLRDYVIGISFVNDEGQEVKAGGRVVKNVAGYDLMKLQTGALGTLGVITQITLKLRPRPEDQALLAFACGDSELEAVLDRLHASRTRPVCLELLNAAAVRAVDAGLYTDAPWLAVVGFEDNAAAVRWQVQQLTQEIGTREHGINTRTGSAAEPLWRALAELPALPQVRLTFKANMLPHAVAGFCRRAAGLPHGLLLQAHAGNGIVTGHVVQELTQSAAAALLQALQEAAGEAGNVIVWRCPPAWKQSLPVWGRLRNDAWLMRQVKDKLDPRRLFNPGRFLDGI